MCPNSLPTEKSLGMVTVVGKGHISRQSAIPRLKGAGLQHTPIFEVLLYLFLHSLTWNDQVRRVKTYGEGCVLAARHGIAYCTNVSAWWQVWYSRV